MALRQSSNPGLPGGTGTPWEYKAPKQEVRDEASVEDYLKLFGKN